MNVPVRSIANIDSWISRNLNQPVLNEEHIRAYQLRKIRETLERAIANSPFHRRRFSGVAPDRIRELSDLSALPFTSAQDLRDEGLQMLCVSQSDIERVVTLDTSGTTGLPKRVFFTAEDQQLTLDFFREGMASFSKPGDRVLILLPWERPGSIGDLLGKALKSLGSVPIPYGFVSDASRTLKILEDSSVDCLVGVPNQVLALLRINEALGQPRPARLRSVLLSTDSVPASLVSELRLIWNCETTAYYAMTELGYGGGIECGLHRGYHLYEGDIYVEIVDPDTGLPLPDGEGGEVVVTTLTRKGMPMIRYRTGDLSRIIPDRCACGSPLRRLDGIKARRDAMFALGGGGALCLSDLDEALFDISGLLDFKAELIRTPEGDRLILELDVLGNPFPEAVYRWRVEDVPGIRKSLSAGMLSIELRHESHGPDYVPHYGKRKITTAQSAAPMPQERYVNG